MEVKWIKICTDIFNNRKIKQIESLPNGDSLIVIWFKLLCLAGDTNNNGAIYMTKEIPYTDQMLSTAFNRPLSTIKLALETFKRFGMIEIIDEVIYISNWEKYQNVEGMDKIREQNRIRQKKFYDKQKELKLDNPNVIPNANLTLYNAIELDKELKESNTYSITKESVTNAHTNEVKKSSSQFQKPSLEEVEEYANSKSYVVNAQRFIDFYESKGWYVGKNKMKDWKAAVRLWAQRDKETNSSTYQQPINKTSESPDWLNEFKDEIKKGNK